MYDRYYDVIGKISVNRVFIMKRCSCQHSIVNMMTMVALRSRNIASETTKPNVHMQ